MYLRAPTALLGCAVVLTACDDSAREQREARELAKARELELMSNMPRAGPEIERRLRDRIKSDGSVAVINDSPGQSYYSLRAIPANAEWTVRCSSDGLEVAFAVASESRSAFEISLSDADLEEATCKDLIGITAAKIGQILSGK